MGEAVMLALVERGIGRQDAHELVRRASMTAYEKDMPLQQVLDGNHLVRSRFDDTAWDRLFDPRTYLGRAGEVVDLVTAAAEEALRSPPVFADQVWPPRPKAAEAP